MRVWVIAATELRRLLRWRANVFFLFVLPMLIILLLGAAFGGAQQARVGVLGGTRGGLARELVTALRAQPSMRLVRYGSTGALQRAVARGDADAGIVIPADYDVRLGRGAAVTLSYFARPDSLAQQVRSTVVAVVSHSARAIAAAGLVMGIRHEAFPLALRRAEVSAAKTSSSVVSLSAPDGGPYRSASGRFESGASTQLLLFIFLNSLNGAVWLIETRRLGIGRRILSTPTSSRTLVFGQLLGRLAIALLQALIIVLGSLLLFGVNWGDPLGTGAVIVSFCLVSTGAAVLLGSVFASEQQAGPVALLLGLSLAALGGSMAPLEIFPSAARTIAHITPHAWANDAFSKLLDKGGDLVTVLPQIAVLLAFAGGLTVLAVYTLRRSLTA
ncbi:MAG: ABC transporter permease [Solirubrobacteraceae bacterium]